MIGHDTNIDATPDKRASLRFGASLAPIAALLFVSGAVQVQAQQPPDVVASDIYGNTAMGRNALLSDNPSLPPSDNGDYNTAAGNNALMENTIGYYNTSTGFNALMYNTTGDHNTADGANALNSNSTGSHNTAVGHGTLIASNGSNNTAIGSESLWSNSTGNSNTASGQNALYSNTTGGFNTASGSAALYYNTTGFDNTADGEGALYGNNGSYNTAVGQNALKGNSTGNNNVAIGYEAGMSLTTGANNIDIGNFGVATESNTIRIGSGQTAAFVAGVYNTKVTGSAVYVTSSGQLGVLGSSERYKTAITSMNSNSAKLQELRPVTFRYKTDPQGTLQYGLIAEEVDRVYPELVIRDDAGKIEGVRYEELSPLLLNEVQLQQQKAATLAQEISTLKQEILTQAGQLRNTQQQVAELRVIEQDLRAALLGLQSKDQIVARR